jgi:hypothetical protein
MSIYEPSWISISGMVCICIMVIVIAYWSKWGLIKVEFGKDVIGFA